MHRFSDTRTSNGTGIDLEDEISLEMDTPGQGERVVDADGFFYVDLD